MKQDKQILARDNKKELLKKIDSFKDKLKKPERSKPTVIKHEEKTEPVKNVQMPVSEEEEVELPILTDPLAVRNKKVKILTTIMVSLIVFIIGLGIFLSNQPDKPVRNIATDNFATQTVSPSRKVSKTQEIKTDTPTPSIFNNTDDWKTYSSKDYKYSIKFPNYLTPKDVNDNPDIS